MRNLLPAVLLLVTGTTLPSRGQTPTAKTVAQQQQSWAGYLNQTRLSKRWGIWLDLHTRRTGQFLDRWSMHVVRPGLIYYPSDQTRLVAGYAYARLYAQTTPAPIRTEHRPWQQFSVDNRYGRLATTQRVRVEERFIQRTNGMEVLDSYSFTMRFRYMLTLQLPLCRPGAGPHVPMLTVQDELMVNAGSQVVYNTFDQNRLFVGVTYPFSKTLSVQAGYMNQFQQLASGNAFVSNHIARVFLIHNLDLREKESERVKE